MGEKRSRNGAKPPEGQALGTKLANAAGRITRRSGIGPEQAGTLNRRLVLDMIRRSNGMSRADLTRATGLTPQATSGIVARLVEAGYLTEIARRTGAQGYPSRIYAINPTGAFSFGASIETDQLTVVLIDLAGHVIARNQTRLKKHSPDRAFMSIREVTEALISTTGIDRAALVGLGLGVPGRYDPDRAVLIPPSFNPEWQDVSVSDELQKLLGIPVFWENDANAAAVGERFRGVGLQFQDLLFIHIGRGIGSGLILSGEPYRGTDGNAGEIGRMGVYLPHLSRDRLRLSEVASTKALNHRVRLAGQAPIDAQDIPQRMLTRDAEVVGWLKDAADAIAQVLCSIIYTLDVEAVVIGGVLPNEAIDQIVEGVAPRLEQQLYKWNRPPSVMRGMAGPDAGALGAATIPLYSVFSARS